MLFLVSVLSITAAAAGAVWSVAKQREDERELVFIGRQFEAAIERYRAATNDPARPYPQALEELLHDDRRPVPVHHLRRLYVDPMTGDSNWGLIRLPDGGIVGVHSLSVRKPYPRSFVVAGFSHPSSISYREWKFVAPSAVDMVAALVSANAETLPLPSPVSPASAPRPQRPAPPGNSAPRAEPEAIEPEMASESTTERVARPTREDMRSRTPEACSRIAAFDEQSCEQVSGSAGDDAARACRDSAIQRSVACALGAAGSLPPLIRNAP
ncbi:MAG: hypothetical protein K2Q07_05540 [Burkholderiaceae bacterium]|nr:hypothetical protein [Burkholderiaceae bacterium]